MYVVAFYRNMSHIPKQKKHCTYLNNIGNKIWESFVDFYFLCIFFDFLILGL